MCRSVGSPVIAKSPLRPAATTSSVERASTSSDSSSGTQRKRTQHIALVGAVLQRAHHRREAALHVVGAAPDQAVALDARHVLRLEARHDVEVAVEDHRRGVGPRPDLGGQHRQPVVGLLAHLDVARLQPAAHERGRGRQLLGARRVVRDEAFGKRAFVDHGRSRIEIAQDRPITGRGQGSAVTSRRGVPDVPKDRADAPLSGARGDLPAAARRQRRDGARSAQIARRRRSHPRLRHERLPERST